MKFKLQLLFYMLCYWLPQVFWGQPSAKVSDVLMKEWQQTAAILEQKMQYDSALVYHQKSIQAVRSTSVALMSKEQYWKTQIKIARLFVKTGRSVQAKSELHQIHRNLRAQFHEKHPLIGDVYYILGDIERKSSNYRTALYNYRRALKCYTIPGQVEELAKTYAMIGTAHQNLGNFDASMEYYDLASSIIRSNFPEEHPFFSIIYNNIGIVHAKLANYKQALSYFKKSLEIDQNKASRNDLDIAACYHNLGALYYLQSDEERALEYLEDALQITTEQLGEQHLNAASLYNDIGLIYRAKQEYKKALTYFQRALHIYKRNNTLTTQSIIEVHHNIGLLYTEEGSLDLALRKMRETLALNKSILPSGHFEFGRIYSDLGNIYFKQGNYRRAIALYQSAKPILEKYFGAHHPEVATIYNRLGEVYSAKMETRTALAYYQKAIQSAMPSFQYKSIYDNPDLDNLNNTLKYYLLNTLHQKAKTFRQLYEQEPRKDYLLQAYDTHQLVVRLLDIIRADYNSEGMRESLISKITTFYEAAVRMDLELYEQTKKSKYLENAFTIMEKSKSTLLLEGIRDAEAKRFGGVPKEILEREEELRVQLDFYKDQVYRLENETEVKADSTQLAQMKAQLRYFRTEHDSLIVQLKAQHPKYYDYKYESPNTTVSQVQRSLDEDAVLIEYMWGANTLYTIGLTKNSIEYHQQSVNEELITRIKRYHEAFQTHQANPKTSDEEYAVRLAVFKEDAHYLYQRLVAPILQEKSAINQLIIIPDNYLGYLSFETLLSGTAGPKATYRSLPYLIRDYTIRYDYSTALLLLADKKRELGKWIYMGVAPAYPETGIASSYREIVRPLQYNQPEVQDILWEIGGHSILGNTATEANFKKNAGSYRILHLAMHAFADDNNPERSRLVFAATNDTLEDNYLHVYELYNMRLKAELAVLSACDTGSGKVHPGEGVISLARAFKFAGCANIVMSLWKANDASTKEIMLNFYKNLHEGMPKSEALRLAKLTYLDAPENKASVHPSYWATFVLIGSDQAMEIGVPFRLRYFIYGIGFFVFIGFYILWERQIISHILTPRLDAKQS